MAIFVYTALKDNRVTVSGRIEAFDASDARRKVREMNLLPTSVNELSEKKGKASKSAGIKVDSLSLREKIDFTSTLEILTSTGIPIIEALMFIEQNSDSQKIRKLSSEFRKQIISGSSLGETLEQYRLIFGRVYIGLVKAGEDSGELDKTLLRMLELLKKQDDIKSKVIGALVYPVMVVALAIVAVLVMLIFVFPAFDEMFRNLGKPLPLITQICMNSGVWMKSNWLFLIIFLLVAFVGGKTAYRNPNVRNKIDQIVLFMPVLCDMLKYSNFANFIAVLQVSYEAGIPIVDCLYLANLTMDNFVLKNAVVAAAAKVQEGTHLSVALKSVKQVPTMMVFMIATGEQSGRLGDSLVHCVNFIDKKLDGVIDAFTKLIEPVLMIFIGGVVGVLALALYLPLFQAYQQ